MRHTVRAVSISAFRFPHFRFFFMSFPRHPKYQASGVNRRTGKPVRAGIFVDGGFNNDASSVGATSSEDAAPDGAVFIFVLGATKMPRLRRLKPACQRQRRCVIQPRVARHELPWEHDPNLHQPQRGCINPAGGGDGCNPVGDGPFYRGPRVGARSSRQPWADGWNAVGVRNCNALPGDAA
jgi:hypothetical protein